MEEGIDNQIEPTIGVDFKVKELEIENRKVKAQLWDIWYNKSRFFW